MPIILSITAYASTIFYEGVKLSILGLALTTYLAGLIVADPQAHVTNSEYLRAHAPLLLKGSCLILASLMLCMLVHQATKRMHVTPTKESMMHQAMAVLGLRKDFDTAQSVSIDSGCTKTVFCNKDKLVNLRVPEHNCVVHGVSCKLPVTLVGDFPVALTHKNSSVTVRIITGCLYTLKASANLLATGNLRDACIGLHISADNSTAAPWQFLLLQMTKGAKLMFNLAKHKGIYLLPFHQDCMTHSAGAASHQSRVLTEVELWQLCL
jgi:hypothetical protein